MIINHNIAAMDAWRNLSMTESDMNKTLERLSSGLRINRAADDAAGLAISEKMRAQINALDQASENAQSGISLLQTAEGALNETTSILQRMRQLAVQASADSANAADRQQMQKEIDQLAQELSRISNTTEFNTKNLLGGAFTSQTFQVGANANQTVSVSIGAMDAYSLGLTASQGVIVADGNLISSANLAAGATATTQAYQIAGTATAATADTAATNQAGTQAQYTVQLNGGTTGAGDDITITMAAGSAGNGYSFNFVQGGAAGPSASLSGKVVTVSLGTNAANNTAANIAAQISAALGAAASSVVAGGGVGTGATGGDLTVNATGYDPASITFSAVNKGTNSGLKVALVAGAPTSGNASATYNAGTKTVTITYNGSASVQDILDAVNKNTAVNTVMSASSTSTTSTPWTTAAASTNLQGGTDATLNLNLLDSNGNVVQSGVSVTASAGATVSFANGLNVTLSQSAVDAVATGSIATQTIEVVTADSTAAVAGSNGLLNSQATVTKGILIDTAANAQAAITAIDAAISKVSTARATLGALQNRLEHTISNLGVTSGNMAAAESRIRDVDMAKEMANFTREQILMQAGTAMLAQANQKPQTVLQLLR